MEFAFVAARQRNLLKPGKPDLWIGGEAKLERPVHIAKAVGIKFAGERLPE
jgi:hypothetical protein